MQALSVPEPGVLQGLLAGEPLGGVDAHERLDKVFGLVADARPAVRVEVVPPAHDHLRGGQDGPRGLAQPKCGRIFVPITTMSPCRVSD